jgi:hypothetical protein
MGHVGNTVEKRRAYKVLVGRCEGRRLPGIRRCGELVDNVKIDLKE